MGKVKNYLNLRWIKKKKKKTAYKPNSQKYIFGTSVYSSSV